MSSKTMTMKVDLSCCDECVQRMKRLLKRFDGVESTSIDVKKGVVIVSGQLDKPEKIIDKIRQKGKPVTLFSIQSDEEDEINNDDSPHPNSKRKKSDANSEKAKGDKCQVHGDRNECRGCRTRRFCASENMRKNEHRCGSRRTDFGFPEFQAHDGRRVHFDDQCGGHGFDSVRYGCGHCHVPQRQFQNCHSDFGTEFFRDDSTLSGCRIM